MKKKDLKIQLKLQDTIIENYKNQEMEDRRKIFELYQKLDEVENRLSDALCNLIDVKKNKLLLKKMRLIENIVNN
jgi:hypothetical protein